MVVVALEARDVDQILKRGVIEAAARESDLHFFHVNRRDQAEVDPVGVTWVLRRGRGHHLYIGSVYDEDRDFGGEVEHVVAHCNEVGASLLILVEGAMSLSSPEGAPLIRGLSCDLLMLASDHHLTT